MDKRWAPTLVVSGETEVSQATPTGQTALCQVKYLSNHHVQEGRERDVVLTMWEWGGDTAYIHDEIASDKRDPRVNADGPVYGVEFANDKLVWVDPQTHESHAVELPVRDIPGKDGFESYMAQDMPNPSLYYGDELIWNNPGNPHNPMMDAQGRVWMTHQIRGPGNPAWCQEGSRNAFAQYYPLERAARHAAFFDPQTESVELIDTCFNTHHLQFGFDDADTLYFSSVSDVVGWIDTKHYEETGDEQASQGWCPTIVDTTGDGRIGQWTSYRETPDPTKDRQMGRGWYGIVPDPIEDLSRLGCLRRSTRANRQTLTWEQSPGNMYYRVLPTTL